MHNKKQATPQFKGGIYGQLAIGGRIDSFQNSIGCSAAVGCAPEGGEKVVILGRVIFIPIELFHCLMPAESHISHHEIEKISVVL